MLSHENLISDSAGLVVMGQKGYGVPVSKDDIHLSYLPLAHVFERAVQLFLLGSGARIGFFRGDVLKLLDDLVELKPTFFPSVPRLLNKIYDKINAGVQAKGGIAQFLF